MNPSAQMRKSETDLLLSFVGKGQIIIEVGCYMGRTTMLLAENNIVIAIDPFADYYHAPDMEGVEELFKSRIEDKNVIWYKDKSENVLKDWNMKVDGICIDGDHSTSAVKIDLGWVKHVKKGGFMAFHDYQHHDNIRELLDKEIGSKYKELGRVRWLIVYEK